MNAERYSRQVSLKNFGAKAQQKLQAAKVLVVGAGGLGVPVLQYLAGMGIGTLGIADGDTISLSNLNRQVLYGDAEVGKPKVHIAAEKLLIQNPSITYKVFYTDLTPGNALEIIKDFDIVVDATDNFSARYLINDACVILKKPFVYGAIFQYEGQVSVFNFNEGPTYRCLYPDTPSTGEIPDCNTAGVLGVVPGIIGCYQALEVVKMITGIGKSSFGFVQIFDLLNNEQREIRLKLQKKNTEIYTLRESYDLGSCSTATAITPAELYKWYMQKKDFVLLDVREMAEYQHANLPRSVLIPLPQLSDKASTLPAELPIVAVCQKGGRSIKAVELLTLAHRRDIYYLDGGMDRWIEELGNKFATR